MHLQLRATILVILTIFPINGQATCGRRLVCEEKLITNGFSTKEGDWPWHAAIYHFSANILRYKCGGTVITTNTILTAAHCVFELDRPIISQRVVVHLGKYNLKISGTNAQEFEAYEIIHHPEYNTSDLSNDIAIIRLSTEATFNRYVQPICLWDETKVSISDNKFGTVIGWGVTETNELSAILKQAVMPIVSIATCLHSNHEFFGNFLSDKNFCAGFKNGTSVCNGDSGGSMSFQENDVHYIRGIVSLAQAREDKRLCNSEEYVIFTDVAQYLRWIKNLVPQLNTPEMSYGSNLFLYRPSTGTVSILKRFGVTFLSTYLSMKGIGGYDMMSRADRGFAFDFDHSGKLNYIVLYRSGTGTIWILKKENENFAPIFAQGDPGNGIGGYDLKSSYDRGFAFDFDHSGKTDYIVMYRPGTGTMWILKHTRDDRGAENFTPVYAQGDPGYGIGGYDLKSPYDRSFSFDYDHSGKMDHIVLYRPGTGTIWILKNQNGNFSPVYAQGDPGNGIGGYDLKSRYDRSFAFDYDHSGKMDHIVLYRPGTGTIWILKNENGNFFPVYAQGDPGNGIGGYDLRSVTDHAFAFDYYGNGKKDHIVLTRPGTGTIWILRNLNGNFLPVYAEGDPGNGIGGYDLKSNLDRIFAFDD